MNNIISAKEKQLFEELRKLRLKASEVFETRAFKGVWKGVVYKYPETAHFVYELLQNADDVKATDVEIILNKDSLIFKHNGSIPFSISEEKDDVEPYGHINAITGVGNSTKTDDVNKIGKFGVGFKAVFQYTDIPHIYDDKFWFKIEKLIIPVMLDEDHHNRKKGETLFYFPFKNPSKSHKEIKDRLRKLDNPILFLKHLKRIHWQESDTFEEKFYSKVETPLLDRDGVQCTRVELNNAGNINHLLQFSQDVSISQGHTKEIHKVSLGYYLDRNGQIDTKVKPKVFCFFPTSESLGLCFVCHAPFLLTESRQQLKNDENLNKDLIRILAGLQAKSLTLLRDLSKNQKSLLLTDNIFDIIPLKRDYKKSWYDEIVSVDDFYEACFDVLRTQSLLLTNDKKYISPKIAYLCNPVKLNTVVKDNQLQELYCNKSLCFVSEKISALSAKKDDIASYLQQIGVQSFTSERFANRINSVFMSHQTYEWVISMYKFVKDEAAKLWNPSLSNSAKQSDLPFRFAAPIVKTESGEWVVPFSKNGNLNVYFPLESKVDGYSFVSEEYLKNEKAKEFLSCIGIKEPDKEAYIQKFVLEKYGDGSQESFEMETIMADFETVFQYYLALDSIERRNSFVENLKGKVTIADVDHEKMMNPDKVYIDSPKELVYFVNSLPNVGIIDYSYYQTSIKKHGKAELQRFFVALGVRTEPKVEPKQRLYGFYSLDEDQRRQLGYTNHTSDFVEDFEIEGLENYLKTYNPNNDNKAFSIYLWNFLADLGTEKWAIGKYNYKYYSWHQKNFDSYITCILKRSSWLLDGKKAPEVTQEDLLAAGYKQSFQMFSCLGIKKTQSSLKVLGASEEQIKNEELGALVNSLGITKADLLRLAQQMASKKLGGEEFGNKTEPSTEEHEQERNIVNSCSSRENNNDSSSSLVNSKVKTPEEDIEESPEEEEVPNEGTFGRQRVSKPGLESMFSTFKPQKENLSDSNSNAIEEEEANAQELKAKLEEEAEKENHLLELRRKAHSCPRYSKEWFDALLELEYRGSGVGKENEKNKAITISFCTVTKENGSERIYVLSNPSRAIPMWIEEIGDIEVAFSFKNREEFKVKFEVANVHDFTLRLKASSSYASILSDVDWVHCTKASISLKNQIELMNKLRLAFNSLNLPDGYNLKNNLQNNISFVFGPPGTGKTTTLAQNICRLMSDNKKHRILVLAPTNTACDELAKKIIEKDPDNHSWLYRFVATGEEELEYLVASRESTVFKDKHCCMISTMARLSFDGFNGEAGYRRLSEIEWDLIICDEASMIPLAEIVYAIYNFGKTPIMIAGDPMQITPIVKEEVWKDENIYSMIKLDRFDNPKTEPIQFEIENLTKQYRSLPAIGELFSQYAYDGKLKHHRSSLLAKKLKFGSLELKPITFIPFRVERYDSVFGPKKLDGSNVHIYSVLLVVETCKYVAKKYGSNYEKELTIGIICPYAPQAQLIDNLIAQIPDLPKQVKISCGTIHRFQGGQCNLIMAVFNPPLGLKNAADKIFLNNKNIINVAISRAQDYLCIFMPHKETEGYENLYELNAVGNIAQKDSSNVQVYTCDEIEEQIFGHSFHIENNTFVTSHQLANVYTKPVKKYEIRIDEKSVDIQVGKNK